MAENNVLRFTFGVNDNENHIIEINNGTSILQEIFLFFPKAFFCGSFSWRT